MQGGVMMEVGWRWGLGVVMAGLLWHQQWGHCWVICGLLRHQQRWLGRFCGYGSLCCSSSICWRGNASLAPEPPNLPCLLFRTMGVLCIVGWITRSERPALAWAGL